MPGCHWSSLKCLLAKSTDDPKDSIPKWKMGSGCPVTIRSHALRVLESYVKKNPHFTTRIIKKEVPEVACLTVHYIDHLIY
jgi:hypothetical protein